jgi:hypothetical protein
MLPSDNNFVLDRYSKFWDIDIVKKWSKSYGQSTQNRNFHGARQVMTHSNYDCTAHNENAPKFGLAI